jgi:hypothetical protein
VSYRVTPCVSLCDACHTVCDSVTSFLSKCHAGSHRITPYHTFVTLCHTVSHFGIVSDFVRLCHAQSHCVALCHHYCHTATRCVTQCHTLRHTVTTAVTLVTCHTLSHTVTHCRAPSDVVTLPLSVCNSLVRRHRDRQEISTLIVKVMMSQWQPASAG